ncbi:FAD-binding protein [Xylanibacter ruminicola]|uniref:UDP-N-acetylenolpyruvoylglucosamine reductase n=1 Tax=Xylanibacter ruminicola TaxID=839 RepID=A0A1M6R9P8_XYLRU|nr:FAD-binding protein [Xylanibacter ruminicola]SHK29150.1 UDP-N-acetylenolpyruvoylglucosamine reductase [Xylanibacter ruminicola]
MNEALKSFLDTFHIEYEMDVALSQKTWIKTGGTCGCWITPHDVTQLTELCRWLYKEKLEFEVVGQTSNMFFHSTCSPTVVVCTTRVNDYSQEGDIVTCGCGTNVMRLSKDLMEQGYAGVCGLTSLPGTVASAVVGNAGCFKCSITALLQSLDCLLPDGTIKTYNCKDLLLSQRSSAFKRGELEGVILRVRLHLEKAADMEEEKCKAARSTQWRKLNQEGPAKNLGSTFAVLKMRKNLRNITAFCIAYMGNKLRIGSYRRLLKKGLLRLYGYHRIDAYVSDKNVNTFVWRDEQAERMFPIYKEMMNKIYNHATLEIEEKI